MYVAGVKGDLRPYTLRQCAPGPAGVARLVESRNRHSWLARGRLEHHIFNVLILLLWLAGTGLTLVRHPIPEAGFYAQPGTG